LKKLKIRSKFNLLMILVVLFLMVVIGLLTKSSIEKSMNQVYEERVAVEAALGLQLIEGKYPGHWNIQDGELLKGKIKINNNNEILDEIGRVTGGIANIFLGNSTVATNIVADGERTLGAEADAHIAEAVMKNGEVYIGSADISGKQHLTMYHPVKDRDGEIIGMWLSGSPIDSINDTVSNVLLMIFVIILIAGTLAVIVTVFFTRSIVQPIKIVNEQLKEIAEGEGDLTKEIHVTSQDEVGEMASSFNKMMATLRTMLSQINITSSQVAEASEQLMASSVQSTSATNQVVQSIQEVAGTIEVQGKNTAESAVAIGEVTVGIQQISGSISSVADAASETMNQANM